MCGGFQSTEAVEPFSCLTRASMSEWIRRVIGSLATLVGHLATKWISTLAVGVAPHTGPSDAGSVAGVAGAKLVSPLSE